VKENFTKVEDGNRKRVEINKTDKKKEETNCQY
jgi:hypothetical protein